MDRSSSSRISGIAGGIATIGGIFVDMLALMNWWRAIVVGGGLCLILYWLRTEPAIQKRMPQWLSSKSRQIMYFVANIAAVSCIVFIWGNVHGVRTATESQDLEIQSLEASFNAEQLIAQELRDDNQSVVNDNERLRDELNTVRHDYLTDLVSGKQQPLSSTVNSSANHNEITDPEDTRNKFIRVQKLESTLKGDGAYPILLEFGVTKLATDGTFVGVDFHSNVMYQEGWYGIPGKIQRQRNPPIRFDQVKRDETVVSKTDTFNKITPRESYYVYVECESPVTNISVQYLAESVSLLLESEEKLEKSRAYVTYVPPS